MQYQVMLLQSNFTFDYVYVCNAFQMMYYPSFIFTRVKRDFQKYNPLFVAEINLC